MSSYKGEAALTQLLKKSCSDFPDSGLWVCLFDCFFSTLGVKKKANAQLHLGRPGIAPHSCPCTSAPPQQNKSWVSLHSLWEMQNVASPATCTRDIWPTLPTWSHLFLSDQFYQLSYWFCRRLKVHSAACTGRSAAELISLGVFPYLGLGLPSSGNALEFPQLPQNLFNPRQGKLMADNTVTQCKAGNTPLQVIWREMKELVSFCITSGQAENQAVLFHKALCLQFVSQNPGAGGNVSLDTQSIFGASFIIALCINFLELYGCGLSLLP